MTLIPATHRLDPLSWLGLPSLACIAATMLFSAPIRIAGLGLPEPVFPLAIVFAWAVIRPSVLAPFLVLFLGLFLDLWWGGPLGLWGLSLLVAYSAPFSMRRVLSGLGWWGLGGWYAASTAAAMTVGVLLTMMIAGAAPGWLGVAFQFLASLALYPFSHRLIERFEDADVRFR
jgi:rod shape-determining protein MreD